MHLSLNVARWLAAMALGVTLACSGGGSTPRVRCDDQGRCTAAGTICVEGYCEPGEEGGSLPGVVDAAGGTVVGPDGVRLIIPANALSSAVTFTIERQSVTAPTHGARAMSRVYEIAPGGTTFATAATVVIPFTTANLPLGTSAGEVAVWRSASLLGDYAPLTAGTPEAGASSGTTGGLSFFVAALPPEEITGDGAVPGGDSVGTDTDLPPGDLAGGDTNPGPGDEAPPGDEAFPDPGDAGPAFGRDCTLDPTQCAPSEPICYAVPGGDLLCTGQCAYESDCPQGACCWDTENDDNPATTVCVPSPDCGPSDPSIPQHRACVTDPDCPRGGVCAGGLCYRPAEGGTAIAGDACSAMTDCDLLVTDGCVHRYDDGGDPAQDLWRVGDAADGPTPALSVCAQHCGAGGTCAANECCRLAVTQFGALPEAFCVETAVPGNCEAVTGLYATCDPFNPSTCDPASTSQCIFFETENAEGRYCSKTCSAQPDCGGTDLCCPISTYAGEPSFCVEGPLCP